MSTLKADMEDDLSILNHPPIRLPGPNLLHLLVQPTSEDGLPAIDFLASDNTRTALSYAELHHAADSLATKISALAGPREDDSTPFIVPVLIPQSPDLYIALLAILKAGGAFCPMNLDVPPERAKFILEDVGAQIVVTTSVLASRLPQGGESVRVLIVDQEAPDAEPATIVPPPRHPASTDLAYLLYTSGSTGTPKGVGISHDAATQSLLAHDRHIPPFSRFLQFAAPTFDVSVFEIFFPLFRGKTLVSCARQAMLNDLPGVLREMEVDACELTPSVAGSLLRKRENAPGLRLLLTIGEMLTQPVVEEFGGWEGRKSVLWGMYGPTEAAIHCTLQPAFAHDSPVGNIGVPLDTVSAFILKIPEEDDTKPEFKVLSRGEIGELAVGGHQLAEGYLNRLELTSKVFIDTPYGRLYRTGDKARMLGDGTLECLGRISHGQVKLRGQRMELGEVEQAALRTPGCHSAVAAVIDSTLVLFCAADEGMGDVAAAVMQSCKEWLPGFMIPGDIVVVESFPRLASGKVDRKGLVAEYEARIWGTTSQGASYKDKLEEQLCDLASRSLATEVRPDQDLLRAGLDSLSAIKLASELRSAGFDVSAVDVLEVRSVSSLSSRLRSSSSSQGSEESLNSAGSLHLDVSDVVADHPLLSEHGQPIEAVVPCTPLQASMLAETVADPRAYCNWVELSVPSVYPETAIRSWFLQLAETNEILRSGFIHHEGRFMQVIFHALDESSILTASSITRDFSLGNDRVYLRPFRVQIVPPSSADCDTRVLLQLHHAVYDGWSLDLMLADLAALALGQQPDPRPQFRQISAYHQSAAFSKSCDAAREFWASNLHGFQPPTLPILAPEITGSSKVQTSTIFLDFSPQEVKLALQRIDCGPQTIFQAALAWLWSSMVGSEDVVVGSIQSGRTIPVARIEDIVGPCIASVPIRTSLSQVRTIRDLVVSVHAGNRAALSHSILPLSEIKRAADIRSGQSIYDVLFVYQESLHSRGQCSDIIKQVAHQDYLETKLLVEVEPRESGFECRLTHHSDAFHDAVASVMGDSIRALVSYMLEHLDSEHSSMGQAFPQELLSVFNPEPTTFAGVPDLARAVEEMAAESPDKDAICFAHRISDGVLTTTTMTFAALNKTSDRIAWHIDQEGVQLGEAVAIIMEKSIRLYGGILAILKTGCAYLPLLPSTPTARIQTILQQAGVKICLVDTATREKLQQQVPCTLIDLQSLDLQSSRALTSRAEPDPNRLAVVIYTSGSTGVPKGVCVTQLNIMSNLDVLSRIYPVKDDSRLLQSCSQVFDVSVFEIFFAWTRGMCLCSATNDMLFEDLERSIRRLGVTHLSMTPTVASLVDSEKVPRVEFLVTAGETMTEVVARKWEDKLFQGYGPSETTNICSVKRMGPGQAIRHLGWSFKNTSTFVLARDSLAVVPFGCLGELCFGGDQVAQGYLGMEELTAAKFINHPRYGRMYRSGDLGRMLPDGSMVIVGRTDEQIKIRGQRVELNEITEAIRQSGDVADCATLLLRGDEDGAREQIVAFLVPRQHGGTKFEVLEVGESLKREIQSLYSALESRLAAYMVPSAIIPISVLPTTPSGKLDRARLKETFQSLGSEYLELVSHGAELNTDQGEWSDVELQVVEAIHLALKVRKDDIQRWTPLTTLGLDSISAIQVSKHLQKQLDVRFPISLILQNPTVARLAKALPRIGGVSDAQQEKLPELLPKDLVERASQRLAQAGKQFSKILPCTPLQEAMLATSGGKAQYLNRMLFRVTGDVTRLRDSWSAMVVRHDILRTCFLSTDDANWPILQTVLDQWEVTWHEFDASQSGPEECISRHAEAVPNAIDSMEPTVSFAVIRQGGDIFLSFVCHHALYDGVAIERLLHEVEQHSLGLSLPPVPAYDQFLSKSLTLPASTYSFWLAHLDGYQPKLTTHLSSTVADTGSPSLSSELDMPLSQIQARVKELGVSLLAATQSAWVNALAFLFRTNDVCFGNVVNGRSIAIEGINELVAPCFNTIPVRMDLSRAQRNLDVMMTFQRLNAEVMEYQFTPLRRIQSLFSHHGDRRLFDAVLLLQQSPRRLDQSLWTLERDDGEMDLPLVCEVIPDGKRGRLLVKMHAMESQPLPCGIVELVFDLFSHALKHCLEFPGSHLALDAMPRELVEKLSQVEYRPPQGASPDPQQAASTEAWTPTEITIRSVLAALSPAKSDHIRRGTTIYQLGLDSISVVQIASMLQKGGHQVLASDVIEHPTCESLGQYLDTRSPEMVATAAYDFANFESQVQPQIAAHGVAMDLIEAVIPCTPIQSAMMAQFIKSGGRDYFNFIDFELGDDVTPAQLAGAWEAVCAAHRILWTGVVPVEHPDCEFAMVQYHANSSVPAVAVVSGPQAASLNLRRWRNAVAQAAMETPHSQLWRVIIVEAEQGMTMHLAIHHALYDAYSLQLILDDLSRATMGGVLWPRAPTQEAVADILGQSTFQAATTTESFWKSQAGSFVINAFPVMTPLRQKSHSMLTESTVSAVALPALEDAASRSGHTLQVILQAAWTRVLSTYLGEPSVVFGVVLSGRNTEATRDASFPCISTLPVIATNMESNRTLLGRMLRYNTELFKQQHQPLTRIQQWLGCSDTRLFDTLLVYLKLNRETAQKRPWRIVSERASVDCPVSIEVEPEAGGRLRYQMTFFENILPSEQARILLEQFDATVQHLAHDPNGHEGDLFKSSPRLFSILPPEVPEIPTPVRFLHQFVENQARRAPGNTALHFVEGFDHDVPVGRKWTYQELDANGNRVARMLLPHVKPGDIVAVCFDKCPEAYFSILGILKAGCAFLALDPAAPKSRNEFILRDSGASVLVTSRQQKGSMDLAVSIPVLGVDENSWATMSADPPSLSRELKPNDVCFCLYTSGTTGTPKGCEITHDNVVQCMLAFQHIFKGHWQEDSRWLQFASLHFDVSVLEQYWSWSVGITLVAAPRDLILEDIAGTISRLGITHIDLTPSLARLLHPNDVPSLCKGVFITGGEALKQEILDVWGDKKVIYNFYGPTEATIGVTVFPRVPVDGRASNIGRQFINVGSYVLKPGTEQPVLRGGVGELCVSGPLVGKGYLKREDLTAERFPILQHFGERVYRTGDLVRLLHDGCFEFLGRADDQVKLRGQRLEIGEINHCIRKGVDAIKDVATLVVRNEAQQKDFLVSFIVSGERSKHGVPGRQLGIVEDPGSAELCRRAGEACRSKLPGYMVPTYVIQLPFIPLSANNKIEIKELRKFFASLGQDKLMALSSSSDKRRGKLSPVGTKIAKALCTMQRIDMSSVTPQSSIFELGVDSISVLRFFRALKKGGFAHANPSLILQHPLIGDLAAALEVHQPIPKCDAVAAARQLVQACEHKYRSLACRELGVTPDQIEYIAPCSPLQQGMISRSAAESAYFNTFRFSLSPVISAECLKDAWQRAFDALPILRTKFVGTADGFVQAAIKGLPLPWSEIQADERVSIETVVRRTRFAWVSGNQECLSHPLQVVLIDSEETRVLVLHIFHGLYDANSLRLMLDRVATEYKILGGEGCQAADLTPAPTFLDALCHGPLQNFSSSKPFWFEHLDGAVFNSVGSRSPSASVITSQREVPFKPLEELRTSLGVTHQALVQAAWVSVLASRLSADPTIGIIVSGRNIELDGAERVVGPLFNTLPFHARIMAKNGLTWSSLVRQCHNFNTAVFPFQHAPLRAIQKWCSGGQPLFDTLFSFQREETPAVEHEDLWNILESGLEPNVDYTLALEATLRLDGALHLLLVAQQDEPDASDHLATMMDGLEQTLIAMAKNPEGFVTPRRRTPSEASDTGPGSDGDCVSTGSNGDTRAASTFPWTDEAILVRNEIAAVAGIQPEVVDGTTPLFGLGLDSIDVVRLSGRLKRQGLWIKISDLFRYQTLEAIMPHVHGYAPGPKRDAAREREISELKLALRHHVVGELADGEIVLPTTPLQESMVVEMIESDFRLYFNHDILEIAPSVDIARLKDAWRAVIDGSPILRTRFLPVENPALELSYCQVIGADSSVHMADVSLDTTGELDKVCHAATLRARQGAGRSDLLQLAFASVGTRRFLVLSIAHSLYDGWSLSLIHRDVRAAYEGRYLAKSLESYITQIHGIIFPEQVDDSGFWAGFIWRAPSTLLQEKHVDEKQGLPVPDVSTSPVPELHSTPVPKVSAAPVPTSAVPGTLNSPVLSLPGEGVHSATSDPASEPNSGALTPLSSDLAVAVEEYSGRKDAVHREEKTSSAPLSEATAFCKTHAITLQTLGQACWAALLAAKTGSLDVTFGVVLSCRDTEALEELVFPTMNTIAIRSVLHGTISMWLRYMQDHLSSIRAHQHFPLREAQKLSGCQGQLFNTLFILQRGLSSPYGEGDEALMQSVGGASAVEYPVCVELEATEDTLVWRMACDGAYASQDETSRMLRGLDQVLGYIIRSPEAQTSVVSEQKVSICGLNLVDLETADKTETTPPNGPDGPEDEVWSPLEEAIRDVLADLSGVSPAIVSKSTTLYLLGLNSFCALRAVSLLRKKGYAVGFRDMVKGCSIAEIAQLAAKTEQSPLRSPATSVGSAHGFARPADLDLSAILSDIALDISKVEEVLPASSMQVHMVSVWQNTKGQVFYPTFTYAMSGEVSICTISAAWHGLVAKLPILRTVFVSTKSRSTPILQVVLRHGAIGRAPVSDDGTTWESRTPDGQAQPYNSLHVHKDGDRWVLRLKMHHALYDAVSLPAIMERFAALCSVNGAQQPASHQFHWRSGLIASLSDNSKAMREEFWTEYLAGVEQSALSFPQQGDLDPHSRVSLIKPAAFQGISAVTDLCKTKGVSLQALFFAAYAQFLASSAITAGEENPRRVVFGIYFANRPGYTDPGAEFYPSLRLVPLRVVLREEASLFEVAEEIQRDLHAISSPVRVDVGLWEIKDWTGVVVDSFVNFLSLPGPVVQVGSEEGVRLEVVEEQGSDVGVSVAAGGIADGYEGREIATNPVRGAYPDAVDVEVSVHGEDMTIGVFGPGERLGREGAAGVIQGIVEVLNGLVA